MLDRGLQTQLDRICKRQKTASLLSAAVTGLLAMCSGYVLLSVAERVVPVHLYVKVWACVLIGLVVLCVSWDCSQTRLQAAFLVDTKLGLKERLTAAVEFGSSPDATSPVIIRLQEDAAAYARMIDPRRLVPYRLPRRALFIPLLLIAAWLVHDQPSALPRQSENAATISSLSEAEQHAEELRFLAEQFLQRAAEEQNEEAGQLSILLSHLADRLERGELTWEQVRQELARLEDLLNAPPGETVASPEAGQRGADAASPDATPATGEIPPSSSSRSTVNSSDPEPAEGAGTNDASSETASAEDAATEESDQPGGSGESDGEAASPPDALDATIQDDESSDVSSVLSSQESEGTDMDRERSAGTGDSGDPLGGSDLPDRPHVTGELQRVTGVIDPAETVVQRLSSLGTPESSVELQTGDAATASGSPPPAQEESSVLRESVPPQYRQLVRRYFEALAASNE